MSQPPEFRGNTHRSLAELRGWTKRLEEAPLEPDLPIIDPHHHLWDDERGRYLGDELLEEFSGHNIAATVYAQYKAMYRVDGPLPMRPVGEVEFVNGIAAVSASGRYGDVRLCEGIVGFADLLLGEQVESVLEALIAAGNGRFRGVRYGATWDSGSAGYAGRLRSLTLCSMPRFAAALRGLSARAVL